MTQPSQQKKKVSIVDTCAYKDCQNGRYTTGSRLHRFPSLEDPRYDVWIQYTANPQIKTWSVSRLRNAGLCSLHFEKKSFTSNGNLKRDAIPKPYYGEEPEELGDCNPVTNLTCVDPSKSCDRVEQPNEKHGNCSTSTAPTITNDTQERTAASPTIEGSKSDDVEFRDITMNRGLPQTYSVPPTIFSDNDEPMEWILIEPPKNTTQENDIEEKKDELEKLHRELREYRRVNAALKKQVDHQRRRSKLVVKKLLRLSKRKAKLELLCKKETVDEFLDRHHCTEPLARTMVKLQLHNKKCQFSQEEKNLAKQLFMLSPSVYTKLRNAGCNLPAESTVRAFIADIKEKIKLGVCDIVEIDADQITTLVKVRRANPPKSGIKKKTVIKEDVIIVPTKDGVGEEPKIVDK